MRYIVAQIVDDKGNIEAVLFDDIAEAVRTYVEWDGLSESDIIFATESDITVRNNNALIDFKQSRETSDTKVQEIGKEKTNGTSSNPDEVHDPG